MSDVVAQLRIESEADVFSARREVRDVAAELGFDATDQVRISSAVSDWGRLLVSTSAHASVTLEVDSGRPSLVVRITSKEATPFVDSDSFAVQSSVRLMDEVSVDRDTRTAELAKRLPLGARPTRISLARLRERFAKPVRTSLLEDLQAQNEELLHTLEQLKTKQQELVGSNAELQETNRGVMAMYNQLSTELEETNRGVVALYAELDERGAQLRDASNAKSRFLASVSHELRSPLNSIAALTKLLRDPDSDPLTDAQRGQLGLIETAAGQLQAMVDDLLDLAKAESGRLQVDVEDVDVAGLVGDLCTSLRPMTPEGVELAARVPAESVVLRTDPLLLGQVLRNLLSNALKFTEAGQVTLVVSGPTDGLLGFAVADSGIGIATENRELVFEEFFQVPGPLQVRSKGTGLGLAYARRVVAALGGSLELSSTPGAGSTFSFALPLDPGAVVSTRPLPRFGTVLLVDDDVAFRHVLRGLLGGAADRVLEADGPSSAIRRLHESRPDLVLLDLRMPEGDGEQVLAEMLAHDSLRDVPVVIITSMTSTEAAAVAGALPVLNKSDLNISTLATAIDAALVRAGAS